MGHEWRCCNSKCLALLGKDEDMRLELKYKDARYTVTGTGYAVKAICPRCGAENERRSTNKEAQ